MDVSMQADGEKQAPAPFADKIPFITSLILGSVDRRIIKQIYLFGSYAYGTPTQKSDIDVCIVIADNTNDDAVYLSIARSLYDQDIVNIDLLLYKEQNFYKSKNEKGIEYTIRAKGRLLYG